MERGGNAERTDPFWEKKEIALACADEIPALLNLLQGLLVDALDLVRVEVPEHGSADLAHLHG